MSLKRSVIATAVLAAATGLVVVGSHDVPPPAYAQKSAPDYLSYEQSGNKLIGDFKFYGFGAA